MERYKGLHAWALQMTANDQALAEDLLHDLFILFTLSQPDLRRIENLDNYLYASLRNLHISQLRRATRARFEQLSVIEYESARLSLHSVAHGRDLIQAQDELRRICRYACARKQTANAASVLILRFFHGYYPTEIAKVIRRTRDAVDKRLLAARVEAKAFLENSQSLAFIDGPSHSATPEVFPARFARAPGDFLLELQETIFQSRPGECLDREQLKHLYDANRQAPIARKHLAHIVGCPTCLDAVNALLGLPLLTERYPTDTMDKDKKKGGGPPDEGGQGDKGADSIRKSLKEWEREAREAFEHKPQELCVSVNGYLLGSQLIGAELSELTLNVTADERISFCEVFSEQGIRLMMMNVEELPPNGPGELHQRIELSEARSLESSLLFSNPFPTLHVSYHDPALATVPSAQEDEVEPDEPLIVTADPDVKLKTGRAKPSIRSLTYKIRAIVASLRRRFLNAAFLMRPGVVTALVLALAIAIALFIEFRRVTPIPSAAELLQQSALAEEALANDGSQALHRTINVEEKNSAGALIALRRVEVWQSAERGVTARRLYDEKGALIAGDWRRSDGVETLYSHGARPQIKPVPEARSREVAALTFDNAWQVLPSAKELNSLLGASGNVTVEERPAEYLVSYSRADQTASGLLKATLVMNRADLHATRQTLTLREGTEVREYSMMEASFERLPNSTVKPTVFEPEPELLSSGTTDTLNPLNPKSNAAAPVLTSDLRPLTSVVATPALEVEVLRLLNQAGADMGEQISVTHTTDGRLSVEGLAETPKRKQELLDALSALRSNPAVKIDIQTLDEALARQPKGQNSSGSISVQTSQPSSNTLPVDKELRQYFAARNVSEAQTDEAIHQFASRAIRRSLQIVQHAKALKTLAQRFSPEELQTLDADAKSKWLLLIKQHAQALQQESAAMRREIGPLFPFASQSASESAVIKSDADLARAAEHLFQMCSENDRVILSAFSISSDSSQASSIKSVTFWRSLQEAETLAVRISDFRF